MDEGDWWDDDEFGGLPAELGPEARSDAPYVWVPEGPWDQEPEPPEDDYSENSRP